MKILWFANTPCGASDKLSPDLVIGGWLSSLEKGLITQDDVALHICFFWPKRIPPFQHNKTMYYPVIKSGGGSRTTRLLNRAYGKIGNDNKDVASLLKVIDAVQPNVIHVHGTESNFGMVQKHTAIPVVVSLQGILSVYYEKFFSGIPYSIAWLNESVLSKLLFLSEGTKHKLMGKTANREKNIFIQTKYILGRTDWDRRVASVLAPKAHYFIGNEILRDSFYERKWDKKCFSTPLQIVTTISWVLYKGLETIVKTSKILCDSNIFDFKWIVIGHCEDGNLAKIVKQWLKIDFRALKMHLVGIKSEKELADILCSSDIFCQVSHIENSSNSLCEAMLLGMPIVATFAGGTDSILENKKEGILVQDGDPYSLAGAIVEVANNYNKATFYANNAYNTAQERHDKAKIVTSMLDTYNNCLTN